MMTRTIQSMRWTLLAPGWVAGALIVLGLAAPAVHSQLLLGEQLVSERGAFDKSPALAGDWLAYTTEDSSLDSRGNIRVLHLPSGTGFDLGPGFRPDIDVYGQLPAPGAGATTQAGGTAPTPGGATTPSSGATPPFGAAASTPPIGPVPTIRVAYLRLGADGTLDVCSATLHGSGFTAQVLAADVGYADQVRVCGSVTAWAGTNSSGQLVILAHDGLSLRVVSSAGQAFRPELARDIDGQVWLSWDAYVGQPGQFDYEIFLSSLHADGQWTAPENVSNAPRSIDLAPSLAPDPAGGLWLAWETDRGQMQPRIFVTRRLADGSQLLPQPLPASSDPAQLGLVDLKLMRYSRRPRIALDGQGRPWVFATERVPGGGGPFALYNKQIHYSVYDGDAWSPIALLSDGPLGEVQPRPCAVGTQMRVAYQINHQDTSGAPGNPFDLEIAVASLDASAPAAAAPLLLPATQQPAPADPHDQPALPAQRTLQVGHQTWELIFADLHSHTRFSPDGMGELDQALLFARDVCRLDAWACADHDTGANEPLFDYEYELNRRLVALFDTPDFVAMMGFEWTNQLPYLDEIIGHRACFDSSRVYRHTDPGFSSLPAIYAALQREDALGVPHHLGKIATGGATFLLFDPWVQPVTQVASIHGIYEDELVSKLLGNDVRFGITAAGDNHSATPGNNGLAGIWIDQGTLGHEAIKQALRQRHCFGVKHDGAWFDFRIEGQPLGSEMVHDGDLLLDYAFDQVPGSGPMTVSVTRDGDDTAPVYQATVLAGQPASDQALIPGSSRPAFYILRLTTGLGTDSQDTILWSSPIWVDPATPTR